MYLKVYRKYNVRIVNTWVTLFIFLSISGCLRTSAEIEVDNCGDGVIQDNEICDDGNNFTETCAYGESECIICNQRCKEDFGALMGYCGDGIIQEQEQCDDGNVDNERCQYGEQSCEICSAQCRLVQGDLTGYCGDGEIQESEACDDGNNRDTDACLNTCEVNDCSDEGNEDGNEDGCEDPIIAGHDTNQVDTPTDDTQQVDQQSIESLIDETRAVDDAFPEYNRTECLLCGGEFCVLPPLRYNTTHAFAQCILDLLSQNQETLLREHLSCMRSANQLYDECLSSTAFTCDSVILDRCIRTHNDSVTRCNTPEVLQIIADINAGCF